MVEPEKGLIEVPERSWVPQNHVGNFAATLQSCQYGYHGRGEDSGYGRGGLGMHRWQQSAVVKLWKVWVPQPLTS